MPDSFGSLRWATHLEHIDFTAQCVFEIEDESAEIISAAGRGECPAEGFW